MWIDYWSQKMSSSLLLHFFNGKAKTQKTHIFAACLHLSQLFHILKHSNYLVRWSPATLDKLSVSELARHPAFTTIFPTIFPTIFVFALSCITTWKQVAQWISLQPWKQTNSSMASVVVVYIVNLHEWNVFETNITLTSNVQKSICKFSKAALTLTTKLKLLCSPSQKPLKFGFPLISLKPTSLPT